MNDNIKVAHYSSRWGGINLKIAVVEHDFGCFLLLLLGLLCLINDRIAQNLFVSVVIVCCTGVFCLITKTLSVSVGGSHYNT